MKKITSIVVICLICFSGYVAAGPFLALVGIKDSLDSEDTEQLSEYVDFSTLRQNIKEQANAKLGGQSGKKDANILSLATASVTSMLVDGMVDKLVTPTGIKTLLKGKNMFTGKSDQPADNEDEDTGGLLDGISFAYKSHDRFHLYVTGENDKVVQATLQRNGLDWKLTNIEF